MLSRVPDPTIVFKARPTPVQLADRLRPPAPEGLEIYLDLRDIQPRDWLPNLTQRFAAVTLPSSFALLVEGPVRSLDGGFFDLTVDSPANREVVDRLARFGAEVGAVAACVHMIAPSPDLDGLGAAAAPELVAACLPLTRRYVARCRDAGMVPTVENVPPVLRQRESLLMRSGVGAAPEHLARLGDLVDGLRFTLDTSHAQLFLNGVAGDDGGRPELRALVGSLAATSAARSFSDFIAPLRGRIATAHVSDAAGLLGEGLPYGEGDMDLDGAVDLLLDEAAWLVTEILEPDPDRSENMRAAYERIARRRARRAVPAR